MINCSFGLLKSTLCETIKVLLVFYGIRLLKKSIIVWDPNAVLHQCSCHFYIWLIISVNLMNVSYLLP